MSTINHFSAAPCFLYNNYLFISYYLSNIKLYFIIIIIIIMIMIITIINNSDCTIYNVNQNSIVIAWCLAAFYSFKDSLKLLQKSTHYKHNKT